MKFISLLRKILGLSDRMHEDTDIQSINVVDSIVKAKSLYKELVLRAHPDRNVEKRDIAEELTKLLTANKFNYKELKKIEVLIDEKL